VVHLCVYVDTGAVIVNARAEGSKLMQHAMSEKDECSFIFVIDG